MAAMTAIIVEAGTIFATAQAAADAKRRGD
jgi:hypothetical protein